MHLPRTKVPDLPFDVRQTAVSQFCCFFFGQNAFHTINLTVLHDVYGINFWHLLLCILCLGHSNHFIQFHFLLLPGAHKMCTNFTFSTNPPASILQLELDQILNEQTTFKLNSFSFPNAALFLFLLRILSHPCGCRSITKWEVYGTYFYCR